MARKKTIFDDDRYERFVERYHADPLRFAVEVCGFMPSMDQEDLFYAMVQPNAKVSVVSGTGCFAAGTMMMRADGTSVAVEKIVVGDRLMGPDGSSVRNVLELKRGREAMYRFTYQDGTSHTFNESHILCLVNTYDKNGRKAGDKTTVTVREYLSWNATKKRSHAIYRSSVETFEREQAYLPIPPYILGIWLGDGSTGKPEITTGDDDVSDAFADYATSIGCLVRSRQNSKNSKVWGMSRRIGTAQCNPFTRLLREAGVFERKHIPEVYKYASRNDRLDLLAGLIDTDGCYDKSSGGYDFVQKEESVAKDVAWIARSVGCYATVKAVKKKCANNGVIGDYWRVTIGRGSECIPVRVDRRKPDGRKRVAHPLYCGIKSVESLGEGQYFGFVLDGDSRFLGADFTVLHNTGKTASFARIALWHLLCHPVALYEGKVEIGSNTYIGAPRIQQVADGVWKELQDTKIAIKNGPCEWIADYFTINKTSVSVNGFEDQWFINQLAMQQGQSVGVAGKHRYWQLIIVDEAAGVPDTHFDVIDGTQTQHGNRTLLASQGVRNAGRFYESHHNLKIESGGSWRSLRFSSERSPFVTKQWLKDREVETGGRDTIEYKIRVRGLFAEDSSCLLLTRSELESAFSPRKIINDDEPYGLVLLADVGMGEYRDDSVAVFAKIIGNSDLGEDARRVEYVEIPLCTNSKNEIDFAGELVSLVGKASNATLYVDHGGVGSAVCRLIERSGVQVEKVDWGKPCFKKVYKERFYNQRACAMVRFRDAIRQGRVVLPQGLDKRMKEKILLQGSRLPYHFAEAGGLRYVMDSKEDMRKNGIKSPDIIDAMSFAFLEDCYYLPVEQTESNKKKDRKESAKAKAADALAGLD